MSLDLRNLDAPAKEERKLVGFTLDDICYGIDIMCVREVIHPVAIIEVPALPLYVKGVTDHRRAVVPIIDLRIRLGLGKRAGPQKVKWIIVKIEEKDVGLEVDRVTQVLTVDPSVKREEIPARYLEKPWIKDVYQPPGQLVFELNLDSVVNPQKLQIASEEAEGQTT